MNDSEKANYAGIILNVPQFDGFWKFSSVSRKTQDTSFWKLCQENSQSELSVTS
jgi:hypothetical protein